MKTTLLGLTFSAIAFGATAQSQYQRAHDLGSDDYVNRILVANGECIVAGSSTSNTTGTLFGSFLRAALDGSILETGGQAGGSGTDILSAISISSANEITLAGRSNSFSSTPANVQDHFVIRLDDAGDPAWITVFGSDSLDYTNAIAEANDGGVIAVGQARRRSVNRTDAVAVKLNATTGAVEWAKEIGFEFVNEVAYAVKPLGTGDGYLVLGYSGANVIGLNEAMVVVLDDDGNKQLAFLFGGPGDDDARAFIDGTGGFYIAGNTRNVGAGQGDAFLAKFVFVNDVPSLEWFKTYGGASNESLSTGLATEDGNILLIGSTQSFGAGGEAFAIKVDVDGNIVWSNVYGGANADYFQSIDNNGSGAYIAGGYSNSFGTNNDVWLVGIDADGGSECNFTSAEFVSSTIDNMIAYMDISSPSLDDITATDVSYTVRSTSTLAFENNNVTENTLCIATSVDNISNTGSMSVFPNPADNGLTTINAPFTGVAVLSITDMMGRIVFENRMNLTGPTMLNLASLPVGIYNLTVVDVDSQKRHVAKVVR